MPHYVTQDGNQQMENIQFWASSPQDLTPLGQLTTTVVERYHNVIKLHKRISFGFKDLDTYIKKITLALVPYRFKPLHTY